MILYDIYVETISKEEEKHVVGPYVEVRGGGYVYSRRDYVDWSSL